MPVPEQTPNLVNREWVAFIKDEAITTLYQTYLRNFEVNNRQQREYSVIWFRQMWRTLNDIAGMNHNLSSAAEAIPNKYDTKRPPYGKILYESKRFYSRHNGKTYNVLIIDNFDYTLPYTDMYGGRNVTISESKKYSPQITIIKESQLRSIIRETLRRVLLTT